MRREEPGKHCADPGRAVLGRAAATQVDPDEGEPETDDVSVRVRQCRDDNLGRLGVRSDSTRSIREPLNEMATGRPSALVAMIGGRAGSDGTAGIEAQPPSKSTTTRSHTARQLGANRPCASIDSFRYDRPWWPAVDPHASDLHLRPAGSGCCSWSAQRRPIPSNSAPGAPAFPLAQR